MRAKARKSPMCSVSLIAIKLKGLAAPGEALKITRIIENLWTCVSINFCKSEDW